MSTVERGPDACKANCIIASPQILFLIKWNFHFCSLLVVQRSTINCYILILDLKALLKSLISSHRLLLHLLRFYIK